VMIKLKCKLYDYRAQKLRITSAMNNRRYWNLEKKEWLCSGHYTCCCS
jgi:hypothetical protein